MIYLSPIMSHVGSKREAYTNERSECLEIDKREELYHNWHVMDFKGYIYKWENRWWFINSWNTRKVARIKSQDYPLIMKNSNNLSKYFGNSLKSQ